MRLTNNLVHLILFFIAGQAHALSLMAIDDTFGVPFGQPLQVEAFGVLGNDSLDGQPAEEFATTVDLVSNVTNGTLTCPADPALELCTDGSFDYTPGLNFSGTDSFTYQIVYGATVSTPATVTLNACTGGPQIYSCWQESSYLDKLVETGYRDGAYQESFEGTEWDTVRSSFNTTNSAPAIISKGITWSTNHPSINEITTGEGPALSGVWGVFDPEHGYAVGTFAECDIDNPPVSCLLHDGISGEIQPGSSALHAVGGYISGFTGASIAIILDGVTPINVGKLSGPGHHFFGVIDTSAAGFSHFEFQEQDGKVGQELLIFADDFILATTDVLPANNPPVLSVIGNQVVNEGELLSIMLSASDVDGDSLIFLVGGAPTGSSMVDNGDGTATFSWSPGFQQAGNYPVSFSVTDMGWPAASDSESITISVGDINGPPVLNYIGNKSVNEGESLIIWLGASDPDGDSLSFAMSGAPTSASLVNNNNGIATFSWTPNFGQAGNYPVSFSVTDNGLPVASDSEAITITVGNVNRPPILSPIGSQTVDEGVLLSILLSASEPDGDSWSFSISDAPTGSTLVNNNDGTATFSWIPDFGQAGNYPVSFHVTDNGLPAAGDSEAITISVGDVNRPPLLNPIGSQTVDEGVLLSILLSASDPDGDSRSFSMSGAPTGASLLDHGNGTATFSWTPNFGQAGNYPMSFSVTDNGLIAASDSEMITITVGDVNRPPILSPIGNQTVNEGVQLSLLLNASDADGDSWSFAMSGAPTGATLVDNNDGTATFSWTPDFGQSGNYPVSFYVTDNGLPAGSDSEAITISVGDVNRPPILNPIGSQTVNEGVQLSIVLGASDPDGDSWSFAMSGAPTGAALVDNNDGTATFSWTPDFGQAGNYPVSFYVTDNGLTAAGDSEMINITVGDVNRPPVLSPIGSQTVNEGEQLSILLGASDADGDSWSFTMSGAPTGASLVDNNDGTATFSWTPGFGQSGNYPVSFSVTDTGLPSASDLEAITISVGNVNRPPILSPIGNQIVNEGEQLSILLTASDPDGDAWSFAMSGAPVGASLVDHLDGTATFNWAPEFGEAGNYSVNFSINDNGQPVTSDSEIITITVGDVNRPPVLSPIGNQTVNEDEQLSILLTASDPDGDSWSFAMSGAPVGASLVDHLNGTATFSWTPGFGQAGNYSVSFTITDNGLSAASDSEAITISVGDVNRPPILNPIGNQAVNEGGLLNVLLTASDPDGDSWSFAMSGAPMGSSLVDHLNGTATFNWAPDFGEAGNYLLNFSVTDTGLPAASDSEAVTIAVAYVNRPPVLNEIGNQAVNEGEQLSVLLTASDPDGDNLSFTITNPQQGSTFIDNGNGTATYSWMPGFDQAGSYPVSFTVSDSYLPEASDSEAITITVANVNRAPVLNAVGNQAVNEGQTLSFDVSASDSDGDSWSITMSGSPAGATLVNNANGTATFSWTPGFNEAGSYPLSFSVTDTGLPAASDMEPVTISVANVNRAPVLNAVGNQAVNEGQTLIFDVSTSDPDGDSWSFAMSGAPTGATLVNNNDGTATFSWTPAFNEAGSYPLSFSVTDNGLPASSDSEAITISVANVNRPPVMIAVGNQIVNEGQTLSFDVSASDPDGDSWSFAMSGAPTGATLVNNANGTATFSWTPGFNEAGSYPLSFSVTDTGLPAASDMEPVTMSVANVNRAPVLNAVGNQAVNEGQKLSFDVSASDPDGDSWSFAMSGAPAGATLVNNANGTATFSWTPSVNRNGNNPVVNFTVTDKGLPEASNSEAITITVNAATPVNKVCTNCVLYLIL